MLLCGSAVAKPLPAGMKIVTKLGRPYVQQGAITVALRDDDLADYEKIHKAELAVDGKTIVVTATRCRGTLASDITEVPVAKIEARLANAQGLLARAKKKYQEAIAKFTVATQKDPENAGYATNLLAAHLRAKKLDVAGQTLAVHGRRNPAWFAWQLAVDSELAAARGHKRAADLVAPTAGTASVRKIGERDLALSPLGGGMAAMRTFAIGSPGTMELDVVSLVNGRLLARFPLITLEDACDETSEHPCDEAAQVRIGERVKVIDGLLASLGFALRSNAFVDVRNGDPVKHDGVTVETSDDTVHVSRSAGERTLTLRGAAWSVAFTPTAVVVRFNLRNLYACDDGSSRFAGTAVAVP